MLVGRFDFLAVQRPKPIPRLLSLQFLLNCLEMAMYRERERRDDDSDKYNFSAGLEAPTCQYDLHNWYYSRGVTSPDEYGVSVFIHLYPFVPFWIQLLAQPSFPRTFWRSRGFTGYQQHPECLQGPRSNPLFPPVARPSLSITWVEVSVGDFIPVGGCEKLGHLPLKNEGL